ncbi:UDP-N-acetylmuramoyl-L-alanyl-D-glutamate synthetase [Neokomagataea thailandica NBRC 106555]|uniref:UDP-N-acetylmuramoylalanine--D-glutamate ligase n=2 Tax=Neokomagataea TaxID=1223423 RepID=A0A4Y6V442_9PROT|nr:MULTISPECIES: UDP-N-acetylmuramoyl-L-alanine--D-glutamate ligase [Neokomagataea]QDH24124.1 UDP-N-acetylmuramoyl-L-alanine--D-glutamate ligase [Neokomagataea tanensis]GBR50450.1 UDP-N-acetylmuramoyl-L-alanyl-D-glutamate synthetase [Neokomagataea thailandica NBRC 106555]
MSFPNTLFAGETFAVLGLGRNGAAVTAALLAMGAQVQAWDDKNPTLPPQAGLKVAPFRSLEGMTALILSPGIPHKLPAPHPVAQLAQAAGIPILSDADLLFQAVRRAKSQARFAAVTGTNGKSTTTALLAHILTEAGRPCAAGGNLGTASLALPLLGDDGVYVIEMSSYMLERLEHFHASTACLLNLTPDHLDRHGDMAGYASAKAHVFDRMTSQDLAVIGQDDPYCRTIADTVEQSGINLTRLAPESLPPFSAPALPGRHNQQNIATAWAMARHLGLNDEEIRAGLATFPGLAHRLQAVKTVHGVTFVNDSKATNAEATSKALDAYPKVIWIAGGQAKSGGISSLAPWLNRVSHAVLIGQDAPLLAQTLDENSIPYTVSHTLDRAVMDAYDIAQKHAVPVVLLSPACASFDQFRSFEDRGTQFEGACTALAERLSTTPKSGTV